MPCGLCQVSLQFTDSSGKLTQQTNSVVIGIGINIAGAPAPTAGTSGGGTLITLTCDPQVQKQQQVSLSLVSETGGTSQGAPALSFTGPTALLSFQFPSVLPPDTYAAYLVVDSVVTPTAQNWSFTPPSTLTVLP